MLKVLLLLVIFSSCFVHGQDDVARLIDRYERIPCSDFRGRTDSFIAEIASHPTATGYVALSASGDNLTVFRRRKMIEEQLALRNLDKNRVVFVRRKELQPLQVELWVATAGVKLPFDFDQVWSYTLAPRTRPFVLVSGGFDESECPPARDPEFVAQFLKANPRARSNIVIRCNKRNCFREMRKRFIEVLVVQNGVSGRRLKFFHTPSDSIYYAYEFWILH